MSVIVENGKMWLSGYVGEYFYDDGFTSGDVVLALANFDDTADLVVFINSGGGVATEGAAIHALFSARKGKTDIVVEGIAASAASLIAMAGQSVTMSAGAVMMIHDPAGFTSGTSDDHAKTIEGLEALATAYARIYAAKSGKSPAQCRTIMREEHWYTPDQAVKEGFADKTTETAAPAMIAAFDYRAYLRAPDRLTALAAKRNWTAAAPSTQAPPTTSQPPESERARMKTIMASPEAKGREDLAEHLTFESDLAAEDVIAVLAKSPRAQENNAGFQADYEQLRQPVMRAVGAGVAASFSHGSRPNVQQPPTLVANMQKLLDRSRSAGS